MKLYTKIILCFAVFLALTGCEENEKSPLPVARDGSFVTIVFDNLILDVTDLDNTAITGTLKAPVPNVSSYDLQVRLTNADGESSDFVSIYQATSFPDSFSINIADLGAALGLEQSDFSAGNRFDFQATSTSTEGDITEWSTINGDLQAETGQLQSYRFTSFISCPFSVEEALGTYRFTNCGFAGELCDGHEFEVVAGDEPNTVVLLNPYNSTPLNDGDDPFAITIQVDPSTGIGSIAEQPAFSTLDYCCAGFEDTSIEADEGFYFSCTGTIFFTVSTTLEQTGTGARFTFGDRAFQASKL